MLEGILTRDALARWLVDCHNKVNVRIGKGTVDPEEALKAFEEGRLPPRKNLAKSTTLKGLTPPLLAAGVISIAIVLGVIKLRHDNESRRQAL
jgi:hypothetical protein